MMYAVSETALESNQSGAETRDAADLLKVCCTPET
jgi:hypothetical protein